MTREASPSGGPCHSPHIGHSMIVLGIIPSVSKISGVDRISSALSRDGEVYGNGNEILFSVFHAFHNR